MKPQNKRALAVVAAMVCCFIAAVTLVLTLGPTIHAAEEPVVLSDEQYFNISDGVLTGLSDAGKAIANQKPVHVIIPDSVTSIDESAFLGCDSLTSVTFSEGLTSIGDVAFMGHSNLTNVTFPNSLTSIGDGAFFGCDSLTSVTFSEGLTSIGDGAFGGCNLTEVILPNSLTTLGAGAFGPYMTHLNLPNKLTDAYFKLYIDAKEFEKFFPDAFTEIYGGNYNDGICVPMIAANRAKYDDYFSLNSSNHDANESLTYPVDLQINYTGLDDNKGQVNERTLYDWSGWLSSWFYVDGEWTCNNIYLASCLPTLPADYVWQDENGTPLRQAVANAVKATTGDTATLNIKAVYTGKEVIDLPTVGDNNTLTFNGKEQTFTPDGFDPDTMTITGNVATEIGTYTVTVTAKDNYVFADGSETVTFDFIIVKPSNLGKAVNVGAIAGGTAAVLLILIIIVLLVIVLTKRRRRKKA